MTTLLALLLLSVSGAGVMVVDDTGGRTVLCRPLGRGERFVLAYTHSMYGGDVRETFEVTWRGSLRRVAMHTDRPAAAEYYAFTAEVVPEDGRYRIDVPPVDLPSIAVRVDDVGAPRLIFANDEVDLLAASGDRHRVILSGRAAGAACP